MGSGSLTFGAALPQWNAAVMSSNLGLVSIEDLEDGGGRHSREKRLPPAGFLNSDVMVHLELA